MCKPTKPCSECQKEAICPKLLNILRSDACQWRRKHVLNQCLHKLTAKQETAQQTEFCLPFWNCCGSLLFFSTTNQLCFPSVNLTQNKRGTHKLELAWMWSRIKLHCGLQCEKDSSSWEWCTQLRPGVQIHEGKYTEVCWCLWAKVSDPSLSKIAVNTTNKLQTFSDKFASLPSWYTALIVTKTPLLRPHSTPLWFSPWEHWSLLWYQNGAKIGFLSSDPDKFV